MISKKEMFNSLKTLYSTYPNVELTDRAVEEWFAIFEKCEIDSFEQAFRSAKFSSGDFLPSPGLVMKELQALGEGDKPQQTKEWVDYPNGQVILKITTEKANEKGKIESIIRHYVDTCTADKWKYRRRMFEAGIWLCIESIGEKQAVYSFQKWPPKMVSSILAEGGYHEREGETLPFLVRI